MLPSGQFMRRGTDCRGKRTRGLTIRREGVCLRACAGLGHTALPRDGVPGLVVSCEWCAGTRGPTHLQPVGNVRVQLAYMLDATVEYRHGLRGRERCLGIE